MDAALALKAASVRFSVFLALYCHETHQHPRTPSCRAPFPFYRGRGTAASWPAQRKILGRLCVSGGRASSHQRATLDQTRCAASSARRVAPRPPRADQEDESLPTLSLRDWLFGRCPTQCTHRHQRRGQRNHRAGGAAAGRADFECALRAQCCQCTLGFTLRRALRHRCFERGRRRWQSRG